MEEICYCHIWSLVKMDVQHRVVNPLKTVMTVMARLLNAPKLCIFLYSLFLYQMNLHGNETFDPPTYKSPRHGV